jgi:hypothetical protein
MDLHVHKLLVIFIITILKVSNTKILKPYHLLVPSCSYHLHFVEFSDFTILRFYYSFYFSVVFGKRADFVRSTVFTF